MFRPERSTIALRRRPSAHRGRGILSVMIALFATALLTPGGASAFDHPFIGSLRTLSLVGSTVPANGDLNPYGVAVVTHTGGSLVAGDILVSNFNNSENEQGTGTTIVELPPRGHAILFAEIDPKKVPGACPGGIGLTTALAVLPGGYVVVGSLPTTNGSAETAEAGCLLVLNSSGSVVETISGELINGPWDMTAVSNGASSTLFVSNVLNGTVASGETPIDEGTVVRIRLHTSAKKPPAVTSMTVIATGFPERTSKEALVVGPTGLALGEDGTLYVADTQGNRIAAIANAMGRSTAVGGGGETLAQAGYLNGPLGLTLAPNGDVVAANGDDGNLVEITPAGAEFQPLDTGAGGGGLFGLAVAPSLRGLYIVNDSENTLEQLH